MFDLMTSAYQGNLTRVTFMMARAEHVELPADRRRGWPPPVSHNNNIPEQVAKKIKVTSITSTSSRSSSTLQATPDGDGNLPITRCSCMAAA